MGNHFSIGKIFLYTHTHRGHDSFSSSTLLFYLFPFPPPFPPTKRRKTITFEEITRLRSSSSPTHILFCFEKRAIFLFRFEFQKLYYVLLLFLLCCCCCSFLAITIDGTFLLATRCSPSERERERERNNYLTWNIPENI